MTHEDSYFDSYFREVLLLYVAIPVLSCLMVATHHYIMNAGAILQKLALGVFCGFLTAPVAFGVRFLFFVEAGDWSRVATPMLVAVAAAFATWRLCGTLNDIE
jgi:hypothetical protein